MTSLSFVRSVAAKRGSRLPTKSTTQVADLSPLLCAELNALIHQSILSGVHSELLAAVASISTQISGAASPDTITSVEAGKALPFST